MADHAGVSWASPSLVTFQLPGKTAGLAYPQATNLGMVPLGTYTGIDSHVAVGGGSATTGTANHTGTRPLCWTFEIDWFERVHLLPRYPGIDFGQIVSTVDERFELFSAYRKANVTMTDVTINVAGIALPDGPTDSTVLGPLTSFLDPASTELAPLGRILRALPAGPASFDSTVTFSFVGQSTLSLRVTGTRVSLIALDFDGAGGIRETLEWRTDVLVKKGGKEQRIALRKQPRQLWDVGFHLTEQDRQRWHALMFDSQASALSLPIWPEQMRLTAAITGGTVATFSVDSTADVDLRIGACIAIWKSARVNEVLNVLSFTSTTITVDSTIQGSYAVGDYAMPVRTVHAERLLRGNRYPVTLEEFRVRFRVLDNDTGAPTGSLSGWSSYNSKLLADDLNFMGQTAPTALEREFFVIDNETGAVEQSTPWDRGKQHFQKSWVVKSRANLYKLRRLVYALRGQQVSFYLPTKIEDLTVRQALVMGDDKMFVENIGYVTRIVQRIPKATFRITFTDATSLVRTVTASSTISVDEERLTLNTTWPADRALNTISRVEFYVLVRSLTDEWTIEHGPAIGQGRLTIPVRSVFDEI